MEIERRAEFVLTERDEADILLLCEIARANGSGLSLGEVLRLTSIRATEEEVTQAWRYSSVLDSKYNLESGFIIEKDRRNEITLAAEGEEKEREARAKFNIEYSRKLAPLFGNRNIRALSISGSTSYLSVSESDDLDFFAVIREEAVWLFLTRALLLARLQRIASPQSPRICLSYTAGEHFAERAFLSSQSGLFARDALTALPILGSTYYEHLLAKSSWMIGFFPKLYSSRLSQSKCPELEKEENLSVFFKIANMFLYYTVGSYIRVKSSMLNRRFAKWGKYDRIFKLRIGADRCIYEARSYVYLRHIYSKKSRSL